MATVQPGTIFLSFLAKLERPRTPSGLRHSVTFDDSFSPHHNEIVSFPVAGIFRYLILKKTRLIKHTKVLST